MVLVVAWCFHEFGLIFGLWIVLIKIWINVESVKTNCTLWNIGADLDVDFFIKTVVKDRRKHEFGEDFLRPMNFLNP